MRKYFLAFLVIILLGFQVPYRISGKYKVVYDKENFLSGKTDYIIEFREKNYTKQFEENETIIGGISRISNVKSKTLIHLRDFVYSHPRAEINNIKPKGHIVMEFEESDLDTIFFRMTYKKQLDRTLNTGKLIKIK